MRFKIYISILILLVILLAAFALTDAGNWCIIVSSLLILTDIALLYRSVRKPLNAVQNGIYLLREQDFGSRLVLPGQPDADRVARLFNHLMDTMKAERLKNLEQDRFLSQLVEASPVGIAIYDFEGNITQTNPAWQRMLTPELTAAVDDVHEEEAHTVRLSPDMIVRISRLWFMDSGFRRQFVLVEPLTVEIVDAEKQMFNRIVRTIGHEVNNTLGSVMSVMESLDGLISSDKIIHDTLTCSRTSCENLVHFVKGYAEIAKLPSPVTEPVELEAWLATLLPTLQGLAKDNIDITLDPVPDAGTVHIDPMLMERVIINIVKNSIESIGQRNDGHILIAVSRRTITVTDNGAGISEEAARRIFTPFFSTKRADRGLGLMLISEILHAHKAHFTLATNAATGLTTFTITL